MTHTQGNCYDVVCQPRNRLFEVRSIATTTFPANNSQWYYTKLASGATATFVALSVEVSAPSVTTNITAQAPIDPRTGSPGSQHTTALKMYRQGAGSVEATVVYRNNTANHPWGLFNGMKVSVAMFASTALHC
jgi:hypothetical protein